MQYQLSRLVAGPFLRGLWRPEVTGAEYVPQTGGAILASNHLSILDSVFLPFMLKRPVTFTAKVRVLHQPAPRHAAVGRLPAVDRPDPGGPGRRPGRSGRCWRRALDLLRQGELFGIYPEGTRSPDGRLYRARPGVGWLAMNSGLPVIPVAMFGTDRVLPPGHSVPRLGKVRIKIGKPMTFGADADGQAGGKPEAPGKVRRAIADEVVRAIHELSGQEYVPMYASVRKEQLAAEAASRRS